jgi:thioredoxin 1
MKKIKCQDFENVVLQNNAQVIVLFSTDWSGSSIVVKGALHELEKETGEDKCFVEIDKEECKQICQDYGIKKVPTILFFKGGGVVEQLNGVPSKNTIHKILRKIN